MIIWTRWGILVVFFVSFAVMLGLLLKTVLSPAVKWSSMSTSLFIGLGLLIGAVGLWFFSKYALPHMDPLRPLWVTEKLPQPIVNEHGATVTHRQVPVVNQATGQQVYSQPTSSLFFIPVRFWTYIVGAVGVFCIVLGVVGVVTGDV